MQLRRYCAVLFIFVGLSACTRTTPLPTTPTTPSSATARTFETLTAIAEVNDGVNAFAHELNKTKTISDDQTRLVNGYNSLIAKFSKTAANIMGGTLTPEQKVMEVRSLALSLKVPEAIATAIQNKQLPEGLIKVLEATQRLINLLGLGLSPDTFGSPTTMWDHYRNDYEWSSGIMSTGRVAVRCPILPRINGGTTAAFAFDQMSRYDEFCSTTIQTGERYSCLGVAHLAAQSPAKESTR